MPLRHRPGYAAVFDCGRRASDIDRQRSSSLHPLRYDAPEAVSIPTVRFEAASWRSIPATDGRSSPDA